MRDSGATFRKARFNHRSFAFVMVVSLGVVVPGFAFAQDEPASDVVSDEAASGDEVVITEKARTHFKAGVNLLQDPSGARYEEAYDQFKAAYAESPSWKILGNLGLAAMNLERYGEAIDAFSEYLEEGGDSLTEQERDQYSRDVETMRASMATLNITAPAGAELIDVRSGNRGEEIKNYYAVPETGSATLRIRPGQHHITAASSGTELGKWSVRVATSDVLEHSFVASQAPSEDAEMVAPTSDAGAGPSRIPAYAALGVGAVGVGLGAVFLVVRGGHNKKARDQFDSCVDSGTCGSAEQSEVEDRDKKAASAGTISLISFGVGAVGIGTGVALLLMGSEKDESPVDVEVGKVRMTPYVSHNQLGLFGSF